jgi:membrane associated rhomboid family serine protease
VGVEEPEKKPSEPRDDLLGLRNRLIVGVVFAILYMSTFGPRSGWAAAVVSGLLGGAVIFLLLKEIDDRRRKRR